MNIFPASSDVDLYVDYVDYSGVQVYPSAASYVVLDADGSEILASTSITIVEDDTGAEITVLATSNDIGTLAMGLREVVFTLEVDGQDYIHSQRYFLQSGNRVRAWENSFVTYNEALLLALDVSEMTGWDNATDDARQTALIEAYANVQTLKFDVYTIAGGFYFNELTQEEIDALPEDFITALQKAQVLESDYLLGGETVQDKRREGLMSETIGESSNMFRPGKPLNLTLSTRALRALSRWLSRTRMVGRA